MPSVNILRRLLRGQIDRRHRPRVQATAGAGILVVDDSPTIRAVLAKMLIQDGYNVLRAEDGEKALELARNELPSLIFLDIVLPITSGFTVLRKLRQDPLTRNIPIIMISGNVQATEQFYVQRFGADDFMKKPFGRAEVFDRIRRLVEEGRLEPREQGTPGVTMVTAMSADEMASIPDVAMPDEGPHHGEGEQHLAMPDDRPHAGERGDYVAMPDHRPQAGQDNGPSDMPDEEPQAEADRNPFGPREDTPPKY